MRIVHLIIHGAFVGLAGAVNYTQCLQEVREGDFGLQGALDNHGRPVSDLTKATAISYNLCLSACGHGSSPFNWSIFSQRSASWLLPWLALICQLPYGAEDHFDNLQSMLLCIGSPALAAYSLALTALNKRWIVSRFLMYGHHHDTHTIVHVLSTLQQAHLHLTDRENLLPLLFRPENRRWWREVKTWMRLTHSWSAPTVASLGWALVAYGFNVFDAFTNEVVSSANSRGIAIGALWLWLLPIVVGWLQISPACNSRHLECAINSANTLVFATDQGCPDEPIVGPISFVPRPTVLHRDEARSPPIFNYSRVFRWAEVVESVAECLAISAQTSSREWPRWFSTQPWRKRKGIFRDSHVWERMFIAGCLAMWLQWGTTSGAIVTAWFSPTIGLGCRSTAYLAYGGLSSLSWLLIVLSSILTHLIPSSPPKLSHWKALVAKHLAIGMRRLGKIVATLNAIGLVMVCIFQFSSLFANCYCGSSVTWWGPELAYNVIELLDNDAVGMKNAWIVGEILAGSSAIGFLLFVNLFANTSFPRLDIED